MAHAASVFGALVEMMILPDHKAVFVSTPRSGTHTMYKLLAEQYGGQRYGDFHAVCKPSHCAGWLVFTTCRNPFTRAVSIWWWGTRQTRESNRDRIIRGAGGDGFEAFCKWLISPMFRPWYATQPQVHWHNRFRPSLVLRLENLAEDLQKLPFYTGGEIPHECRSEHPGAAQVMTPAAEEMILKWADDDFKRFGYGKSYLP